MWSKKKCFQKILLVWYMKEDNFGDVLIYKTVSAYLKENDFEVECHEVGDNCNSIFEHANQCDFLLFAGGGIIERYIPDVIRNFKKNYALLKVPYGIMGFGMGDFDYSKNKEEISFWVNNSKFFYARDERTKEQLDIIAESDKVKYSADCVFGNKSIYKELKDYKDGHGINMRDLPYQDLTGDFNWEIINLILKNLDCNIIIPDCSKEIKKLEIKFENQVCLKGISNKSQEEKVENVLRQIEKCEWIIAMRFHVILVAAMLGIVSVPIMYCPKVKHLAEQLGIKELAVEIGEVEDIPKKISLLERRYDYYTGVLNKNVKIMKKKANEMFEEVIFFLYTGEIGNIAK